MVSVVIDSMMLGCRLNLFDVVCLIAEPSALFGSMVERGYNIFVVMMVFLGLGMFSAKLIKEDK